MTDFNTNAGENSNFDPEKKLNEHGWDPNELLKIHITKGELMGLLQEAKESANVTIHFNDSEGNIEKSMTVKGNGPVSSNGGPNSYRIDSDIFLAFLEIQVGLIEKRVT